MREFDAPAAAPGSTANRLRAHDFRRRLGIDLTTNRVQYELNGSEFSDASLVCLEAIDLKAGYTLDKRFDIQERDPLTASEQIDQRVVLARGDWKVTIKMDMALRCDASNFYVMGSLTAREGEATFATRHWHEAIPRRLV